MAGSVDASRSSDPAADTRPDGRRHQLYVTPSPIVGLVVVLVLGLLLRVLDWIVYSPVEMNLNDSNTYVEMAQGALFGSAIQPAGYPLFLRIVHVVADDLWVTVAVQHFLGLATAVLMYALVRRAGGPGWAAVTGGAAVALSLDQIFLEHALLTETLFTFLLVAALYAAVRSLTSLGRIRGRVDARLAWIALAGLLLGVSATVRTAAALLIPFWGLWAAFAVPTRWRVRALRGGVGVVAAVAVVLGYAAVRQGYANSFALSPAGGWAIYSRIAPFADCSKFTPPAGTAALCERVAPVKRPGPDFYGWQPTSPAVKLFGGPPTGGPKLSAFAKAAIVHQPGAYAAAVINDTMRYFAPGWNDEKPYGGPAYDLMDVNRRAPDSEAYTSKHLSHWYDPVTLRVRGGVEALSDVQQIFRVQPLLLLQALLLGFAGLALTRGPLRATLVLLLGLSLLTMVIPAATALYSARYAIPVDGPLIAAGCLGLWLIVARARGDARAVTPNSSAAPTSGA